MIKNKKMNHVKGIKNDGVKKQMKIWKEKQRKHRNDKIQMNMKTKKW